MKKFMVAILTIWKRTFVGLTPTGHHPVEPDPFPHMDKPEDPEIGWTTSEDSNW